jgi:hypothetical protein
MRLDGLRDGVSFGGKATFKTGTLKRMTMKRAMGILTVALAIAGGVVVVTPTAANAWVCRADSRTAWGWARHPNLAVARYRALRQCAARTSRRRTCYITWCR